MLKQILSITGKPGLFKIISSGKNMLLVEDIATGKRLPAHAREKLVSLGDVAIYTDNGDMPLAEVLDKVYAYAEGKTIDVKALVASDGLRTTMEAVLPEYDRDHVYTGDIKKLFTWYNLLVNAGFTKFVEEAPAAEEQPEEQA
jgi:hypothetical protein